MRAEHDDEGGVVAEQVVLVIFRTESQQVRRVLLEYVSTYREYSAREDKEDFKLFVRGIAQKVAHCLEEEVALELGWAE